MDNIENPLVSVIVPVYNYSKYIEKCINSLLTQNYENIEIIVIDDGSSDNSYEIADKIAQKDTRVKTYRQENKGVSAARNYGADMAKGKYLLFVDADDYVGQTYIQKLVENAEKNQSELCFCGYTMIDEVSGKQTKIVPRYYEQGKREEWAYVICITFSRIYLREFWQQNEIRFIQEKDSRGEDMPVCIYTNAMASKITMIHDCDYYYVQHEGSAMNTDKIFRFPYKAAAYYYNRIKKEGIKNNRKYLYMAMLKMFALFEYKLYRKASKTEKKYFADYISAEYNDDLTAMKKEWWRLIWKIDLPIQHKVAISLLCLKY